MVGLILRDSLRGGKGVGSRPSSIPPAASVRIGPIEHGRIDPAGSCGILGGGILWEMLRAGGLGVVGGTEGLRERICKEERRRGEGVKESCKDRGGVEAVFKSSNPIG